jgi:hypothetical protein
MLKTARLHVSSAAFLLCAAAAAGCGDEGVTGPAVEPAARTETFAAGPFAVPAGDEQVICSYVRGTNEVEEDVVAFQARQTEGGHHLIVYAVDHAIDLPPSPCNQGGQPNWRQLLVTQLSEDSVTFPEGVGFRIAPHQQLVLETHFINTSGKDLEVESSVTAQFADEGEVTQRAASYFVGTYNIDVPPSGALTKTATCTPPVDLNVHTMFGHEHARGTGVRTSLLRGAGAPELLYQTADWHSPEVKAFAGGLLVTPEDALQVTCDWQNDTTERLRYPHEMCFAIGYYWPSQGDMVCATGGADDTECRCFFQGNADNGPGGGKLEVQVTRADAVSGAGGAIDEGAPLYCALWAAEDWQGFGPKDDAPYRYLREAIDVPLTTTEDHATMVFDDVTPGDYVVFCMMDAVGGGPFPGSGNPINSAFPATSVPAEGSATYEAELNLAIP